MAMFSFQFLERWAVWKIQMIKVEKNSNRDRL